MGFEDNNIPQEYNIKPEEFVDNESENESFCDSSSDSNSEYNSNTSQSDDEQNKMKEAQFPQEKAKMMCQFFFSSLEGDFSWPVVSFPLQKNKSQSIVISNMASL